MSAHARSAVRCSAGPVSSIFVIVINSGARSLLRRTCRHDFVIVIIVIAQDDRARASRRRVVVAIILICLVVVVVVVVVVIIRRSLRPHQRALTNVVIVRPFVLIGLRIRSAPSTTDVALDRTQVGRVVLVLQK